MQGLKDRWAQGDFSASFELEMLVKNAGATGACSVYTDIVDLDYNQIVTGAADETGTQESIRSSSVG